MTADDEVMSNEADDVKGGENEVDGNDEMADDVTSDDDIEGITDGVANGDDIEGITGDKDEGVVDIIEEVDGLVDGASDDESNEVIVNETDVIGNELVSFGRPKLIVSDSDSLSDSLSSSLSISVQFTEQSLLKPVWKIVKRTTML